MFILHCLKTLLLFGPKIIFCYFAWMRKYAKNPGKYPIKERYTKLQSLIRTINNSLNLDIHVVNIGNVPSETCAIMSNHLAEIDPIIYIHLLSSPVTFVCKKEVSKFPFVGKCVRGIDGEFLDREDLKQSLRVMMRVQEDLTNVKAKNWLIFPEGTRNRNINAKLLEFHHGTFRPAMKAGVPIVPAAIFGTFRALKKPVYKKYPVYVEFGEPIYPKDYQNMTTNEVAALVQSRVQKMITYHARKYDQEYMVKHKQFK